MGVLEGFNGPLKVGAIILACLMIPLTNPIPLSAAPELSGWYGAVRFKPIL